MDEDGRPGTREDLRLALEAAGLGPRQTAAWLDGPTPYPSGLVPAIAITDPATAARTRYALRRLIARLGDPIPDGVQVTDATIREPGTYLLELTFAWPGGTAVRHWDAEPYLGASRIHETLLSYYDRFAQLHIANRRPGEPGGQEVDFAPELLFGESWPIDRNSEQGWGG